MKLLEFRITNFRSIQDTGWCSFCPDGVTVLVGQNESGKSSILDALGSTFSSRNVTDDDCRFGAPLPEIRIRVEADFSEIANDLSDVGKSIVAEVEYFFQSNQAIELVYFWKIEFPEDKRTHVAYVAVANEELGSALALEKNIALSVHQQLVEEIHKQAVEAPQSAADGNTPSALPPPSIPEPPRTLDLEDLGNAIYVAGPTMVLFDQRSGLLPDRIDIVKTKDRWELKGEGLAAASNFLTIAEIDLADLMKYEARERTQLLARANARLTKDFTQFWSQTIGKREPLELSCTIENYGTEVTGKAGQSHLAFWVSNGFVQLYPKQRSEGVRWFVSFYLQLRASEKSKKNIMFLLDEPGANLHSKAQADVLKLVNDLRKQTPVIYSTHSPDLIEAEHLGRVLAVQRDGDRDDSPTTVIAAHHLGSASRETLSAILSAMGADIAHHQVIRKKDNVLLEEISAFYYLTAFWKLTGEKQSAYFIAATGASNLEPWANMFLGWGLDFIVTVDDDQHGREAYKSIKNNVFGGLDSLATTRMYKLKGCPGIEDIFSNADFAKFVLSDASLTWADKNSAYVKKQSLSKPILAFQFLNLIQDGKVQLSDFDDATTVAIKETVDAIASRLKAR